MAFPRSSDECIFIFYYRLFVSRTLRQSEDLGWRAEVRFGELCITELPNHKFKSLESSLSMNL